MTGMLDIVDGYMQNHFKELYDTRSITIYEMVTHMMFNGVVSIDKDLTIGYFIQPFYPKSIYSNSDFVPLLPEDIIKLYDLMMIDRRYCDIILYWETTGIPPSNHYVRYLKEHSKHDITHLIEKLDYEI